MSNTLKVKLWNNPLTAETAGFTAVPVINTNLNTQDLIALMKAEGMEIKTETALDIITRFFRKAEEMVLQGNSINIGFVIARPTVKGVFKDDVWDKEKHYVQVSMTAGAELRKNAAQTRIEILGEQGSPMALLGITDKATGSTDGSLTKGKNAELRGTCIKIAGDHADCGVAFTHIDTRQKIKLGMDDVAINEPARLLILVPKDLPTGSYELSVTTQSSTGSKLLKEPRTETLRQVITIV